MRLLNLLFPERRTSAVIARERLKIVLAHDNLPGGYRGLRGCDGVSCGGLARDKAPACWWHAYYSDAKGQSVTQVLEVIGCGRCPDTLDDDRRRATTLAA